MTNQNNQSNETLLGDSLVSQKVKTSERDLILPVLIAAAKADQIGYEAVTSAQLYKAISPLISISQEDEELSRRDRKNVTRLQQTFRNAFSHGLFKDYLDKVTFLDKGIEIEGYTINKNGKTFLLNNLLANAPSLRSDDKNIEPVRESGRILENMVAKQILLRLAELQPLENKQSIPINSLRKDIKSELPLSKEDLEILSGRADTRIDQVIRNVISHNKLTKNGFVTRDDQGLLITDRGRVAVLDMILEKVPLPNFGIANTMAANFEKKELEKTNPPKKSKRLTH